MLATVAYFLASALLVDLIGYWLHRWAHRPGSPMHAPHMVHHVVNYPPRQFFSEKYRSSKGDSLTLWFAPAVVFYVLAVVALGLPHQAAIYAGLGLTVVASAVVHDLTHIGGSVAWRWRGLRGMAVRHHAHHHKMGRNFGIVTPLWDALFRTRRTARGTTSSRTPRGRGRVGRG